MPRSELPAAQPAAVRLSLAYSLTEGVGARHRGEGDNDGRQPPKVRSVQARIPLRRTHAEATMTALKPR